MGQNVTALLSYFLSVRNFLLANLNHLLNYDKDNLLIRVSISAIMFFLVQLCIALLLVPEKLKYPSYVGCSVMVFCLCTFWYLNLLTRPNNYNKMRAVLGGDLMNLAANSFFGMESITVYFAIRSSMAKKSSFDYVISLIIFISKLSYKNQGNVSSYN